MTMIAGAVSFDRGWNPRNTAQKMAFECCRYAGLSSVPLIDDPRAACYAIERDNQPEQVWQVSTGAQERLAVVGDVACPVSHHGTLATRLAEKGESALHTLDGRWVAIAYRRWPFSLRLISDRLGAAWLYIARTRHGFLFCSDYGVLTANLPQSLNVDYESALVELALGYSPDSRTCFEEVTVLPPRSTVELTRRGLVTLAQHRPAYGDRFAALSHRQKLERLDHVWEASIGEWCPSRERPLLTALSPGHGAHHVLALLNRHQISPRCMSFAHPRSEDARHARCTAARLRLPLTVHDSQESYWEGWHRSVEQMGYSGHLRWTAGAEQWLGCLKQAGSAVVTDYLGDALSGGHLVRRPHNRGDWLRDWEEWSLGGGWIDSPLPRSGADQVMRSAVSERLRELARNATYAFPHQQALHLDLYGRQRRHAASTSVLLSRFLRPVPLYYCGSVLHFWTNLAFEDLDGRALYLAHARTRFPALFDPARPGLLARMRGATRALLQSSLPGVGRRLCPPGIDRERAIVQNRQAVLRLCEEVLPLVERFFHRKRLLEAIERFPNSQELNVLQLGRLINLLMVLRLTRRENLSERTQERLT
jgi:hypothetical protein